MAATVRIARVLATANPAASRGTGTSSVGTAPPVVAYGVGTGKSRVTSAVSMRLADVTATAGQAPASIRLADVAAYSPSQVFTWDGTEWVLAQPPGIALSIGGGRSSVSGTTTVTGSGTPSAGKGRSQVSATVALSGTLALAGGGSFQPSGGTSGPANFVGTLNLTGGGSLTLAGSALQGPPGDGSLTVIPDPTNTPPRVLLELTGALGTTATIVRVDSAGNQTPVRLADPEPLDAGTAVVYDYEAPYNTPVTYVAETTAFTITSDPVTLVVSQPWLVHPGVPDLSMPILVAQVGDRTRDTNQGVHRPLGRADAIVITDGQRWSPTFNLTIGVSTVDEERALEALLDDTSPLLLQIVYPGSRRTMYEWVSVGTVTESDLLPYFPGEYQTWTLPCTVTSAPSGMLQAQRTLGDVSAEFATLGDIAAAYATMRDIITDNLLVPA